MRSASEAMELVDAIVALRVIGGDVCKSIESATVVTVSSAPAMSVKSTSVGEDIKGDGEFGLKILGVTGVSHGVEGTEEVEALDGVLLVVVVGSGGGRKRTDAAKDIYPKISPVEESLDCRPKTSVATHASMARHEYRLLWRACHVLIRDVREPSLGLKPGIPEAVASSRNNAVLIPPRWAAA